MRIRRIRVKREKRINGTKNGTFERKGKTNKRVGPWKIGGVSDDQDMEVTLYS